MSKFTPGPWDIEKSSVVTEELEICDISYCDKNSSGKWILGEASQANAHLIAAAPEMLDALKDALEELETMAYARYRSLESKMRAAIAKAEGRE